MIKSLNCQGIKPESVRQIATRTILKYLKDSDLEPGDKIPSEKEFMEQMQIGRSSIREVLHSLVALGVLKSRPGKGYFLNKLNVFSFPGDGELAQILIEDQDVHDLLEVREVLEERIATLAIQRVTEEDIRRLEDIMAEAREAASERDNISDITIRLHRSLARATKNPIFAQLLEKLVPLIVSKAKEVELPPEEDIRLHEGALTALKSRDEEKLQEWVRQHLDYMRTEIAEHNGVGEDN